MSIASPPDGPDRAPPRVLVLSGRAMFRRTFVRIVDSFGHACEAAEHPPGQRSGAAVPGGFDLVLADLGDAGADAARTRVAALLDALGGARTACVVDRGDDAVVDAAMAAGAAGVLVKAAPPTVLTDSLALLFAGGSCRPAPSVSIAPDELPDAVRARLGAREQKMLRLVAGGASIPAVAAALHLTEARVVADVRRIMEIVRGRA